MASDWLGRVIDFLFGKLHLEPRQRVSEHAHLSECTCPGCTPDAGLQLREAVRQQHEILVTKAEKPKPPRRKPSAKKKPRKKAGGKTIRHRKAGGRQ
jgi:hypothetical protein